MQRLLNLIAIVLPWLIIGGLMAAVFYKPEVVVEDIPVPAIGTRDDYYGVAVPSEGTVWLAGLWGKVIRSDDNGETWTIQETPTREHLQAMHAWNDDVAIVAGNDGRFIRTEDGGETWTVVENVPRSEDRNKIISIRGRENGEAWAVGFQNAILQTTDYGKTWTRHIEEQDRVLTDVAFAGDRIYVVGEYGITLYSDDGGETWTEGQAPVEGTLNGVAFRDERNGIAVGIAGTIVVTHDGGETWQNQPPAIEWHLFSAAWNPEENEWFAVGDKGRYVHGTENDWEGGRLSENDVGWHTRVASEDGAMYIAGATVGRFNDGEWHRWGE